MNILDFIATIKSTQSYPEYAMTGLSGKYITIESLARDCSVKKDSSANPPLSSNVTSETSAASLTQFQTLLSQKPLGVNK